MIPDDHGSEPSSSSSDNEEENYHGLRDQLAKKWLNIQLTHEVSASATESFWKAAMGLIPPLFEHRRQFEIKKKVPGYKHLRRQLFKDNCPEISMKFAFMKRSDRSIEVVDCNIAPTRSKSEYIKLYEEAHIKVSNFIYFISFT